MDKQAALNRLTALESEAAELRRIIEAPEKLPGLWRPSAGEICWHVTQQGRATDDHQRNYGCVDERMRFGNCFPSREIAEKAAPLMARANKIIAAALQADPDAGLMNDRRSWGIYLKSDGKFEAYSYSMSHEQAAYVHTKEQAEEMARILNAEGVR